MKGYVQEWTLMHDCSYTSQASDSLKILKPIIILDRDWYDRHNTIECEGVLCRSGLS